MDYRTVAQVLYDHRPKPVQGGRELETPLINLGRTLQWRTLVMELGMKVTRTADELRDFYAMAGYPISEHPKSVVE